jgi:hypothetical protein
MKRTPLAISILALSGGLSLINAILGNIVASLLQERLGVNAGLVLLPFVVIAALLLGFDVRDRLQARTADSGDPATGTGRDHAGRDLDKRRGLFVSGGTLAGATTIGVNEGTITIHAPAGAPVTPQQQRNRRAILAKVRAIWIDGLLTHSLYQEVQLALGLVERASAVQRPLDLLVRQSDQADQPIPSHTKILEVFDRMDGALLILGAPGRAKPPCYSTWPATCWPVLTPTSAIRSRSSSRSRRGWRIEAYQ